MLICPALFLLLMLQNFNLSMHVYSFRAQSVSLQCDTIAISPPLFAKKWKILCHAFLIGAALESALLPATALLSLERLLVTIAAEAATIWQHACPALCWHAPPYLKQGLLKYLAGRAPQSTTASSQVREAAKRSTTCGVDVLIWTELRRSCAAEHLVHTGRSSCECWNRLKEWYFCFWSKIFILEICYGELWARALL